MERGSIPSHRHLTVRTLGAILAGGRSRRFGTDKAAAMLGGVALLDHVAVALAGQAAGIVVAGRSWPGLASIADRPVAGLGPLGGLLAALEHAAANGFGRVLAAPCDCPALPEDLAALLAPAPAVVAGQPVIGLWPAALAGALRAHLADGGDRSMRRWVAASGARRIELAGGLPNVNTRFDLAAIRRRADPRSSP